MVINFSFFLNRAYSCEILPAVSYNFIYTRNSFCIETILFDLSWKITLRIYVYYLNVNAKVFIIYKLSKINTKNREQRYNKLKKINPCFPLLKTYGIYVKKSHLNSENLRGDPGHERFHLPNQ